MARQTFSRERFDKGNYDLNEPLDAARVQSTIIDFMKLVREDTSTVADINDIVVDFVAFEDDREV